MAASSCFFDYILIRLLETWKCWAPQSQTGCNKQKGGPKSFYSSWVYTVSLKPKLWKHSLLILLSWDGFQGLQLVVSQLCCWMGAVDNVVVLARLLRSLLTVCVSGFGEICFQWPVPMALFSREPLVGQLWGVTYALSRSSPVGSGEVTEWVFTWGHNFAWFPALPSSASLTPSSVMSGRTFSLNHLFMNPHLKFCF